MAPASISSRKLQGEQFTKSNGKLSNAVSDPSRSTLERVTTDYKLHPTSLQNSQFKFIRSAVTKWINSILTRRRLQVTDINKDMSDGTLIAALLEELTGEHIVEWETTTSEKGKVMNMLKVVKYLDTSLNIREDETWTRIGVFERDHHSTLALMVHISHAVGANLALPSNVSVAIMKGVKADGALKNKTTVHKITGDEVLFAIDSAATPMSEAVEYTEDVFDGLVDSPEKLSQVSNVCQFLIFSS